MCPWGSILICLRGSTSQSQRLKSPIWGENKQPEVRETMAEQITSSNPAHSTQSRSEATTTIRANPVSTYLCRKHSSQCLSLSVSPPERVWPADPDPRYWPVRRERNARDTLTKSPATREAFTCEAGWVNAGKEAEAGSIIRPSQSVLSLQNNRLTLWL